MSMASWAMTAPTQLISYHEVKFLEAEALCRLGGRVDAVSYTHLTLPTT